MNELVDAFDRKIKLGDYVSYSVKTSSSIYMRVAKVWKITWAYDTYRIGVIAAGDKWDWKRRPSWFYGAYKTTLTANSTLLIVTNVPDKVKNAVEEYENQH